jgi:hypothetical protein
MFGTAFLLLPPDALAGEHVRGGDRAASRTQAVVAPVARAVQTTPVVAPVTIAVAVTTPSKPATEQMFVNLRGPDGKLRRFPIEGGREAIQSPTVVVLRPGQSVTIQMTAK